MQISNLFLCYSWMDHEEKIVSNSSKGPKSCAVKSQNCLVVFSSLVLHNANVLL